VENGNHRTRDTREMRRSSIEEQRTLLEEDGAVISVLMSGEVEVRLSVKFLVGASAYRLEGKSLVVLQVNCESV
jgi:hypothetical protein